MLKIHGYKGEIGGQGDPGFVEHRPLPLLRGGKIYLEDMQRGKWIAIGESIETGAEDDILRDAVGDCVSKLVFNIAAAHGHESAKVAAHRVHRALHVAGMA